MLFILIIIILNAIYVKIIILNTIYVKIIILNNDNYIK